MTMYGTVFKIGNARSNPKHDQLVYVFFLIYTIKSKKNYKERETSQGIISSYQSEPNYTKYFW